MRRPPTINGLALALALLMSIPIPDALASDHRDIQAVGLLSEGDLTDLYAWMSPDGSKLNLAVGWESGATMFSDAVVWAIDIESRAAYAGAPGTKNRILCAFDVAQHVSCWLGDEYVSGDGTAASGVTSASGRLRVFAGRRNDPFFFNKTGFVAALALTKGLSGAPRDGAGCPTVDGTTSAAVLAQLAHGASGNPPQDDFAGGNFLALVFQIDKTLVTTGGPVLAISASTYKKVQP